jgi:hypothetical protein
LHRAAVRERRRQRDLQHESNAIEGGFTQPIRTTDSKEAAFKSVTFNAAFGYQMRQNIGVLLPILFVICEFIMYRKWVRGNLTNHLFAIYTLLVLAVFAVIGYFVLRPPATKEKGTQAK